MSCANIGAAIAPSLKIVSVDGVAIPRETIAREAQHHPAHSPATAWNEAARALVIRQLLLDEARRLALEPAPLADGEGRRETDEEALVRQVIETQVKTPTPDDATCRRYYEQNRKRFRSSDLFEADHILFAAAPSDTLARQRAKSEAKATIAVLHAEPRRFGDLAKAHSACTSGQQGGTLGQITRGATTAEFEKALAALEPGETSKEPVETRYGFHIIRLGRRIDGRDLPFEAVHDRIADYLAEAVERRALAQYVSILAAAAAIVGIDLRAV
jgi:peptidyl-prolyl cis-trans isomerase C